MKKILLILSMALLTILYSGCETKEEETFVPASEAVSPEEITQWDNIVQRNQLKIGVPNISDTFDNQLIEAFCEELEIEVLKVVIPWDESVCTAVSDGTVDMLWGQIPATADTSSTFRLSTPYFNSTILYIARTADWELDKTTVIGVMDDSAEEMIVQDYYDTVYRYPREEDLFYALSIGECDVALYNKPLYETFFRSEKFHIIKEATYELVVAFEHNNVSVCTEVEKILAKIKAEGTASEICLQWYPLDLITK